MSPGVPTLAKQFIGRATPLQVFMDDERVTDILINGARSLFVERGGELVREASPFSEPSELFDLMERMLIPIGKRIDAAHPYLDGRLTDGSRFHIIIPPNAAAGPVISNRKISRPRAGLTVESFGPPDVTGWLGQQVVTRKNLLICGGTGVGKTTLLGVLLDSVGAGERITLVEETREIFTLHPHAVQLEARAPSPDGTGEVTLRSLIRNALRMRPDRIVLGECRGAEAFDILQAMNTGHAGSLCTIHANGAMDALKRLEGLAMMAGLGVPLVTVREWIASSIHVVAYLERRSGQRAIGELLTVQGMEGERFRIMPRYKSVSL